MASLRRIAIAVIVVTAVLFFGAAALIRQPFVARVPVRIRAHADPAALRRHVEFLSTTVTPRDADHVANLDSAAEAIRAAFARATPRVREQTFIARRKTYRNVIASFGPDDATQPLIVVGAHYDAFGKLPGADDNASGTAGLLELARLLATQPPAVPVELVAYANEEPPFFGSSEMGSAVHADALAASHRRVRAMLCLEMIGCFHGEQRWGSAVLSMLYPKRGDFIAIAGGWDDRALTRFVKATMTPASTTRVYSFTGPHEMTDASDQRNYWSHGWPAVMIGDTAYVRNPNYHTARDTANTLDYAPMATVVDGVFNALLSCGADIPVRAPSDEGADKNVRATRGPHRR